MRKKGENHSDLIYTNPIKHLPKLHSYPLGTKTWAHLNPHDRVLGEFILNCLTSMSLGNVFVHNGKFAKITLSITLRSLSGVLLVIVLVLSAPKSHNSLRLLRSWKLHISLRSRIASKRRDFLCDQKGQNRFWGSPCDTGVCSEKLLANGMRDFEAHRF